MVSVVFEVESIDRMDLNVWQPRLAYGGGVQGFFVGHMANTHTAIKEAAAPCLSSSVRSATTLRLPAVDRVVIDHHCLRVFGRATGTGGKVAGVAGRVGSRLAPVRLLGNSLLSHSAASWPRRAVRRCSTSRPRGALR